MALFNSLGAGRSAEMAGGILPFLSLISNTFLVVAEGMEWQRVMVAAAWVQGWARSLSEHLQ